MSPSPRQWRLTSQVDGIGGDYHGEAPDHGSGKTTQNNHPPAALAALVG